MDGDPYAHRFPVCAAAIDLLIDPLLVGAGVVALLGESQRKKCAAEVAKVEQVREQATEHSVGLYRDAMAQLVDARLLYQQQDEAETDLLHLVDTWPTVRREAEETVA